MRVRILLACLLYSGASPALPQGYAGLGTPAEGFDLPRPDTVLSFPEDHGPHPGFRIEWWYLTGNLKDAAGTDYGFQWTLFRSALGPGESSGWESPQIWMGHAAVTSAGTHRAAERLARGGIGTAGVTAAPFEAWIGGWKLSGTDGTLDSLSLTADAADFTYRLDLKAEGPLILQGDQGYSVKSQDGQASHYYSQPFYRAEGALTLDGGTIPVTGSAWLDREWSSQPLSPDQAGWDWFSLNFDDGSKLMGFQLRSELSSVFSSGTYVLPDGRAEPLKDGELKAIPVEAGQKTGSPPERWRIEVPRFGIRSTVEALNPDSWMDLSFSYWEGPVVVSGSHSGKGYLEMTGYERPE